MCVYRNKQMCVFFCSEQRRRAQLSFPNSRLFILPSDQSSVIASARKTGPKHSVCVCVCELELTLTQTGEKAHLVFV